MTETFAPPDIEMERRDDGTIILSSRRTLPEWEPSITAVLRKRAASHPNRSLAAQGGTTLTYGEAERAAAALAREFVRLGLGPEKPVMILSGNSLDHLLVSLAAYAAHAPVMPISVAYSLMSKDHARIKAIAELTRPGARVRRRRGTVRRRPGRTRDRHRARGSGRAERRDAPGGIVGNRRSRQQSARWRARSGCDRQTPIHIRIDRRPQGGHQHPPDAVLEPGGDQGELAVPGRRAADPRRLAPRGATRSVATTT